ncbi:MAG: hypothetical protein QXU98_04215 [Candidatus Parvarchaeota archaeon]
MNSKEDPLNEELPIVEWIKSIDKRITDLDAKINRMLYIIFGLIILLIITNPLAIQQIIGIIHLFLQ